MNRDMSISKTGSESSVYENHNIRILARDNDTLLSVTNERGNKLVDNVTIFGTVIGWNILNNNIIVFSHSNNGTDRIYRIKHTEGDSFEPNLLFSGNLNFSADNPIESIVYFETEEIQKIYWIDGINVLRFMNFAAQKDDSGHYPWQKNNGEYDNTYFDSNRQADFGVKVSISKDNSGNTRPNGTVQYLITYFNKHGQETGHVWFSDIVYLSPIGVGGSADGTNNNIITLTINNLDTSFTNFRVYSIFRSTNNGQVVAYLVGEQKTSNSSVRVIDDFAHLEVVDSNSLQFLGSKAVIAGTLTAKDETLFLGDLKSIGRKTFSTIEDVLRQHMFGKVINGVLEQVPFVDGDTWEAFNVSFAYSNDDSYGTSGPDGVLDIPYVQNDGNYPFESQLQYTSSNILSFKGGEKYRFALKFKYRDGSETDAFWIGDKVNPLYPVIDIENSAIKRIVAKCFIPKAVIDAINENDEYCAVQLMIADAEDADRSVKAQGIVNPTMFNAWERYNNRIYSMPSWISRPRGSQFSSMHFESVKNAVFSNGEIQCNYWKNGDVKTPYFRYKDYDSDISYDEEFEGSLDYHRIMLVYKISRTGTYEYNGNIYIIKAVDFNSSSATAADRLNHYEFSLSDLRSWERYPESSSKYGWRFLNVKDSGDNTEFTLEYKSINSRGYQAFNHGKARRRLYDNLRSGLDSEGLTDYIISFERFNSICAKVLGDGHELYFNLNCYGDSRFPGDWTYTVFEDAANAKETDSSELDPPSEYRWRSPEDYSSVVENEKPAYFKKHLMFVDENVVTLDSPELAYNKTSFDNASLKFRIVGVAKMSSVLNDYLVEADDSYAAGDNLEIVNLSDKRLSVNPDNKENIDGMTSWPLWRDAGLDIKQDEGHEDVKIEDRTSVDYNLSNNRVVRYWLHMWHKTGSIIGYTDENGKAYSVLKSKTFANLRFSYVTIYLGEGGFDYNPDFIRISSGINDTYKTLKIGGSESKYYDGRPELYLGMPGVLKYPLSFSYSSASDGNSVLSADDAYLYSASGVVLRYSTQSHAVIGLPTRQNDGEFYTQSILPRFFENERIVMPSRDTDAHITGALIPWSEYKLDAGLYRYRDYRVEQRSKFFTSNDRRADILTESDNYLFVGEVYKDFGSGIDDTRYGGIRLANVASNRFIVAGPQYLLSNATGIGLTVIGNQGDTYFQRWDALRVKPYSIESENSVIDITSSMLETHINLDGRTDLQRGIAELASINTEKFGSLNDVYSQKNSFVVRRDLDSDFNVDSYRSSITWTLPKATMSEIDEWSHITLAGSLALDGDKGVCSALHRFGNSIIAFQDRAVSEILFNSRTQLSTKDGVPVEIANSGKVDGKRYLSNKFGCTNKWSIVDGKNALYFIDDINKALCSFNGNVSNISSSLGFGSWFRKNSRIKPWRPNTFDNMILFYDRIHSDVYIVGKDDNDQSCLVYNESLNAFTSFFDYGSVNLMANIDDKFVSVKNGKLWLQNEGLFCNFFGLQYSFWTQYRIAPNITTDKIWTNLEYRADFYRILNEDGESEFAAFEDLSDADEMDYIDNETFDTIKVWNEYQTTGEFNDRPDKKFRIWRYQIPRALSNDNNIDSLDRIRNPWINLLIKKTPFRNENRDLMQMHDISVKYFE